MKEWTSVLDQVTQDTLIGWGYELAARLGGELYPRSLTAHEGKLFFLMRRAGKKRLGIFSPTPLSGFSGEWQEASLGGHPGYVMEGPADATNAAALRATLPFLRPRPLGLVKSVGLGDRLGLATPGHVRAVRHHTMVPIFAQQSIREMERTGRSPQQVMDDALWGVFQEGWRADFGADADHLKTFEHVDRCVAAGFTFFTVDPSDYVDNTADRADEATVRAKVDALPWGDLDASPEALRALYVGRTFDLGDFALTLTEEDVWRAAAKYGAAVAHTVRMYRYLRDQMGERPFELEMSVDETETPTRVVEHIFVASELKRLAVEWVSLAPRFVGRFEKGVDYIGDLEEFRRTFRQHVAVARALGPYKLSLHSGSDKFSIYPVVAEEAGDLVHLKTAGTSYLVALEVVARYEPGLFREILAFARARYETDRATYHVSAHVSKVPPPEALSDVDLPRVLHEFHGRQVLHVTFGSVLTAQDSEGNYRFRDRLLAVLREHEDAYSAALEQHFNRHLAPFDL